MSEISTDTRIELAEYIERIEALEAEKSQAAAAITAEVADMKSKGFDVKAVRQIIRERKADLDKTIDHRAITKAYREALGLMVGTDLGDWARRYEAQVALKERRQAEVGATFNDFLAKRTTGGIGDAPNGPGA